MREGSIFRSALLTGAFYLLVGASLCLDSRPAHADLIVCNQSGETLSVSIAYHKSANDAWTASGHYPIGNNDCDDILLFDLNETVYYAAMIGTRITHPLSGQTTSFCVDMEDEYEVIWDGDNNSPWYKDLDYKSDEFRPCEDIHSDYRQIGFHKISSADSYDHCTVSLGSNGEHAWFCWD